MRIALAILMGLHGIAHIVGFLAPWQLAQGMPYKTTVLSGSLDLGPRGIRALGVLWLVMAIAFLLASAAAFAQRPSWPGLALGVSAASIVLSVISWPEARIGVAVNLAIIVAVTLAQRFGSI
jgi:hypothetical protein